MSKNTKKCELYGKSTNRIKNKSFFPEMPKINFVTCEGKSKKTFVFREIFFVKNEERPILLS
jgi:hypothetical protein